MADLILSLTRRIAPGLPPVVALRASCRKADFR